jgi:polyisoprenoid-binding protein YceI
MKTIALLVLSAACLLGSGCKSSETTTPPAGVVGSSGSAGSATITSSVARGSDTVHTLAMSDNEDHVTVLGRHRPAKPTDPVSVRFDKFRVVNASFDPSNLEGGTATIEIDLASLTSGSGERDDDLKSPTYIDVAKFTTATIEIAHVKHKVDKTFTADATVKLRGATKIYPVTFDVTEQTADSVRIKGERTFSRLDFSIGTDPVKDPQQQVDTELTIQLLLTLKKP